MSKLITIVGNSGSGKTMLSYFLANALCKHDKRVMIVSTNYTYPDFPYLFPIDKDNKTTKSLGRVLSLALINKQDILSNMITFKNSNIGLLCYATNESKMNYPSISANNLETFFAILNDCVDYIIVDTQPTLNDIDNYAISVSNSKLCITTVDMKGLAFRQQINEDLFTHILFSNNKFNPYDGIKTTFKKVPKYELPFCAILQSVYNGYHIDDTVCPKNYSKFLSKLILEVLTDE